MAWGVWVVIWEVWIEDDAIVTLHCITRRIAESMACVIVMIRTTS